MSKNLKKKWLSLRDNLVTTLANISFLSIWVIAQYGLKYITSNYRTEDEINDFFILFVRIVFAIGTVVPILINMYGDFRIMLIQISRDINTEKQLVDER